MPYINLSQHKEILSFNKEDMDKGKFCDTGFDVTPATGVKENCEKFHI